ncbi:MAG: hypothetical protein CVU56_10090 [Deltaproteobacteria bacterium HGW-Deltaproteobacteria-14]|nr:MAG: hypothetical protein CVU56_10090 [Deltaproteobacteria bacterium HGW-Deltaproteobacteria-14]
MSVIPDTMEAEAVPERTASSPDDGPPAILETDEPSEGRTLPILADDPTSLRTWEPPRHERRWRLFVFLGACLVFLPNLGGFGLWDPWETHYGAVSTEMLDTYDWVSPWWGYREKIGDKQQGSFFYSKPVFIFWTEAIASRVIGRGEWALRLPIALLAILSVFLAFIVLTKVWSRRVGLLGALIMATSPEFFMISRQAQTDMPFVATMLISLLLLIMAFFGPREPMSDKRFMRWTWLSVGFLLLNTLPQYGILITDINYGWVHALVYVLVLALLLWWFARDWRRDKKRSGLDDAFKDRWLRKYYLIAAFVFFAHSTYAKGLLGFMMPGAIILIWLVVTRTWAVLKRAELIRGTVTFAVVGFPWYAAMFVVHGKPYYDRFIIHDHFKRLGEGVHQIDSGTFEHFIKWLGVGTFPWVAFVPLALLWLIRLRARDANPKNQAKVFAAVWFMVAFAFFTASSTKFHHYIFPAFPALAIILALFIDRLLDEGAWLARLAAVTGVVVFFAVGWDIHEDHQHLRNLMTYKYDRPLAQQLPIDEDGKVSPTATTTWKDSLFFQEISPTLRSILTTKAFKYNTFIEFLLILGAIALALFFVAKTRMAGLVGLGLCASMLAVWSLNYYMPSLTPGWSQKYLFDSYYRTCNKLPLNQDVIDAYEPFTVTLGLDSVDERSPGAWTTGLFRGQYKTVCEEDVIGWLITWRGETYYSWNELKPIEKKEEQFGPYLRDFNGGKKFYILIERGKTASFKSELVSESNKLKKEGVKGWTDIRDWDVQVENDENLYFQMASATPLR